MRGSRKIFWYRNFVSLLGIRFDDIGIDEAVDVIVDKMNTFRPECRAFSYVVTPNADHLVRASENVNFLESVYAGAWMCLLDSRAVAKIAKFFEIKTPNVVTGSDLTAKMVEYAVKHNETVTILGLSDDAVDAFVENTGLKFNRYNPPMGFEKDFHEFNKAVMFIENNPAKLVLLAVGSPRQELIAQALLARGIATGVGLCIGASLDFLAGKERRAPRSLQRLGLEWAWRLAQNPQRMWRRYLINCPKVVGLLRKEAKRKIRQKKSNWSEFSC